MTRKIRLQVNDERLGKKYVHEYVNTQQLYDPIYWKVYRGISYKISSIIQQQLEYQVEDRLNEF